MNPRPMPQPDHNKRETGARKYPASKAQPAETDTQAGVPTANPFGIIQPLGETSADMPTANPFGITQPDDESSEKTRRKTRQSDGVGRSKAPKDIRPRH